MDETRFLCLAAVGSLLVVKGSSFDPSGGFYGEFFWE